MTNGLLQAVRPMAHEWGAAVVIEILARGALWKI
jgi:hypothetical protein